MSTHKDPSAPSGGEIQHLIDETHSAIANARKFLNHLSSETHEHARRHIERILLDLERRLAELHARARHDS